MSAQHHKLRRRTLPALMASGALALIGAFGVGASSASAARNFKATQEQSQNWAGYVVKNSAGKSFSSVSGSWTQPTAKANSGTAQGYSAFWVGLGGPSSRSQSLEQVGTSADSVNGRAKYYAWYELLPSAQVKLSIAIHPGDHISARVTVSTTTVTIWLSDTTTGQSVTKSLRMNNPDTSSAEWIAESPSTTTPQPGVYQTLPLANFGKATFTAAFATADGHTGSISDPSWSAAQVQLTPASNFSDPSAGGSFSPAGSPGVHSRPLEAPRPPACPLTGRRSRCPTRREPAPTSPRARAMAVSATVPPGRGMAAPGTATEPGPGPPTAAQAPTPPTRSALPAGRPEVI